MEQIITDILKKHGVVLGYLFGSHARGTSGPLSDIDVAVVLPVSLSDDEQFAVIAAIRSDIQNAFRTDFVDVINLNTNKNPALRRAILFEGVALVVTDKLIRKNLELKAVREYEDTKFLRDAQFRIIIKKFYVSA
jgi:predicted nucleotidyltransferase